ncbi:MAG TPA: hypothetical protein VEL11_10000, partial [Candidatus Bathyarchaeia archaeon]|nr:hypothetical protein [Candidatus Bathyarchaeia archaeon]
MRMASPSVVRLNNRLTIFLTLLLTTMMIIGTPLNLQAQSGISFYSPSAPPSGIKSFQNLIVKFWDWRANQPSKIANNWPICLKADVTVGDQSVVFLGDPAAAPAGGANVNATHQACQISSSPLLYSHVYGAYCSQGDSPGKSIPQLLTCAQDENKIIKLMQAKVDGVDVSSNILRETTSQPFIWTIRSSDNVFAEKLPCCGQAMAEMYDLLFKPLPTG